MYFPDIHINVCKQRYYIKYYCVSNARKMSNIECGATEGVSISLLSDCKVNLITIDGSDTPEAKRDVACLLRRHIYIEREYFADQVPPGNKFSRKGKEFSVIGNINVLGARGILDHPNKLTYHMHHV